MPESQLIERIVRWIKLKVKETGAKGGVIGLSGGIDSSVVAYLAQEALGSEILGLIMPCYNCPQDEEYALLIAKRLKIKFQRVCLDSMYDSFCRILPSGHKVSLANVKSRLRMITLYYFANNLNYLVLGTGNKSEIMVGYFTKYGDGAADLLPIGGLLKGEVRKLAEELRIPPAITKRIPSAGLWEGQTDEREMGISYERLDQTLLALKDKEKITTCPEDRQKVQALIKKSKHKRSLIPVFIP